MNLVFCVVQMLFFTGYSMDQISVSSPLMTFIYWALLPVFLRISSSVIVLVIWLNIEVQLLSNNLLVHLQDLFTCALEVARRVIGRGHPETELGHVVVHWLGHSAH